MGSRYQRYSDLTNSDVPWVGIYPSHWEIHQLKRSVDGCVNGVWGSEPDGDSDFPVVRVADFDRDRLAIKDRELTVRAVSPSERRGRLVSKGDLLIEKSGGGEKQLVGAVMLYLRDEQAVSSNFVARMAPRSGFDSIFLRYTFAHLYSGRVNFPSIKQTTGIQNLDSAQYLAECFSFPPLNEQQTIARFLDHETAKIDELIAQQEKLIALLKEKRQAVISHAVTKGLNPDAPMKDSGVEWLGEVPAHWAVTPLRYLGYCQNGINIGADSFGSGYPFIGYTDVYKNRVLPKTASGLVDSSTRDREIYSVKRGDVFFTRTSETVEEVGFASTCLQSIPDAVFAGFVIRFRPTTAVLDENFSKHYFGNELLRGFFNAEMNLVTRASLSQDLLKRMCVPIPPKEEQKEIGLVLDRTLDTYSRLLDAAASAIDLLKERRTALISAAVTGKIDVRHWQPESPQPQAPQTTEQQPAEQQ